MGVTADTPLHDDSWRCIAGHQCGADETTCRACAEGYAAVYLHLANTVAFHDRSVDYP